MLNLSVLSHLLVTLGVSTALIMPSGMIQRRRIFGSAILRSTFDPSASDLEVLFDRPMMAGLGGPERDSWVTNDSMPPLKGRDYDVYEYAEAKPLQPLQHALRIPAPRSTALAPLHIILRFGAIVFSVCLALWGIQPSEIW